MKVQILESEHHSGLIAKLSGYVQRQWPVEHLCELAQAQDVVSNCLGYKDYNELQTAAVTKIEPGSPTLDTVLIYGRNVLAEKFGIPTEEAQTFISKWPLDLFAFANAPRFGIQTPVTRHHQWRHLLREYSNKPGAEWFSRKPALEACWILQPIVATARAMCVWFPTLLDRKGPVTVDLVNVNEYECLQDGRFYAAIPLLLQRPDLEVRFRLIGTQAFPDKESRGLVPLPPAEIIRMSYGKYRSSAKYRKPDLTIVVSPGPMEHEDSKGNAYNGLLEWMEEPNGLKEAVKTEPILFLNHCHYMSALDKELLSAFGLRGTQIDNNPFSYTMDQGQGETETSTYGCASWRTYEGTSPITPEESAAIKSRIQFLGKFCDLIDAYADEKAIQKVHSYGEKMRLRHADGSTQEFIYMGKRVYIHPTSGEVFSIPEKGDTPHPLSYTVHQEALAEYPGPQSLWIERARWMESLWNGCLAPIQEMLLFMKERETQKDPFMNRKADAVLAGIKDPAQKEIAKRLFFPDLCEPRVIPKEHQAFFQALNQNKLDEAVKLIKADPSLAHAVNQKGQNAFFYACRAGHKALAQAVLDQEASTNGLDDEGWPALLDAAKEGHLEFIDFISFHPEVDINVCNMFGWTALLIALSRGKIETALALAELGADMEAQTADGQTVSEFAKKLGIEEKLREAASFWNDA